MHVRPLLRHVDVLHFQRVLAAITEWRNDQSDEQIELLAAFMEPVLAALLEFAKLEDKHMKESPEVVRIHKKVMKKLHQIITAKSTRTEFTAISTMLKDAMDLLDQAVNVANLVQGGEVKQAVAHVDLSGTCSSWYQ
jgi:predicted butyrate kinase (DUF1464 family)